MRKRVVICHFYNEEYLLPWWLMHHQAIFDHGVLIDYSSTDRSAEICRQIAPNWEVRKSRNPTFSAVECDAEVMDIEREFSDAWKIALNVTEFFCLRDPEAFFWGIEAHGWDAYVIRAAMLVDPPTVDHKPPTYDQPLVQQRWHGFFEDEKLPDGTTVPGRGRILHRRPDGRYGHGRHVSVELVPYINPPGALLMHFLYSPWLPQFWNRKLQIGSRVPPEDLARGMGTHHILKLEELERRRAFDGAGAKDLRESPDYARVFGGWSSLMHERPQSFPQYVLPGIEVPLAGKQSGYVLAGLFAQRLGQQSENGWLLFILEIICKNELDRHPGEPYFSLLLSIIYFFRSNLAGAEEVLRDAIRRSPDHGILHFNLSVILKKHGSDVAVHHHRVACALDSRLVAIRDDDFVFPQSQ